MLKCFLVICDINVTNVNIANLLFVTVMGLKNFVSLYAGSFFPDTPVPLKHKNNCLDISVGILSDEQNSIFLTINKKQNRGKVNLK